MLTTTLRTLLAAVIVLTTASTWAYDHELAAGYAQLFEPVVGAKAGKALHLMKPEVFVENLKNGKHMVALDVRTPAEFGVFSMALQDTLTIPVNELFKTENLDQLPTDGQLVVVCKSGTRATAVGTALRHIGFDNVYILKGGLKGLSAYLDPKIANTPPKPEKVAAR